MAAVLGFVAFVIAAVLKLTNHNPDTVLWLIIIGGALVCAEVAWGWHRGGYYRR